MDSNQSGSEKILKALSKRALVSKVMNTIFIYMIFLLVLVGFYFMFITKNNSGSAQEGLDQVLGNSTPTVGRYIGGPDKEFEQYSANTSESIKPHSKLKIGDLVFFSQNDTDKVSGAIFSIIMSISIMLFIVYAMKIFIVFIKYNTEVSNDYENQKIAFLMSDNNTEKFDFILKSLREHNVKFDKMPSSHQEKIIESLANVINGALKK